MNLVRIIIATIILSVILAIPFSVNASALLSDLQVEGIGSVNISKKSYNLSLTTPYDTANIIATPADSSVTVEGAGQVPIQEGANTITVTATNGTQSETYTINLNVSRSTQGEVKYDKNGNVINNPETGSFINYALFGLIGAISLLLIINLLRKKKFYNI